MGYEFSLLTAWGQTEVVCGGGRLDLCTQPTGFGLNQIIIKTQVRKTEHNYFFLHIFPTLHTALSIYGAQ